MDVAAVVVDYYRKHGRDLPWRRLRGDAYAIWVCEIMAQQTRLEVVIPYWRRWMARFPTVAALAGAQLDDVLAAWSGLGYYARARSLHRAARQVIDELGGVFPDQVDSLLSLPGIGPYTAGAIASIAFGRPAALVDGNVSRILSRLYGIEDDVTSSATRRKLWGLATALVPAGAPAEFNQGLMDLGATVCTPRSPRCPICPLAGNCLARRQGRQDELPLIPRRREPARVALEVAWARRGERFLLMRRAPRGLFGGLWELPAISALPGAIIDGGRPLARHTHKLTHRTFDYRVFAARLAAPPRAAPPYDAARFVAAAELARLGVSSATATLAEQLLQKEKDPWPTPNAPSSSSRKATTRSSKASASSATTSPTTTSAAPRGALRKRSPR